MNVRNVCSGRLYNVDMVNVQCSVGINFQNEFVIIFSSVAPALILHF